MKHLTHVLKQNQVISFSSCLLGEQLIITGTHIAVMEIKRSTATSETSTTFRYVCLC